MSVPRRWTVADLEQIEPVEGERYEVIDGELYVAKQPSWEHQSICITLGGQLEHWSYESGRGSVSTAPGVIFSRESGVAPDLAWMSWERLRAGRDSAGHVHMAPELLVEVVSPGRDNERRDRKTKLALYSREGVDEYWIVDWQQRIIDVFRRTGDALELVGTLSGDDVLESPLLPGFRITLGRIWPPTF
ncbi:MAG TPA: Uma2 family endonuclease [Chloroflexota bacterium]|nr:Uma2 family endonuclease [Chloroflexota bacterium]